MKPTVLFVLLSCLLSGYHYSNAQSLNVTPFVSGLTNPIDIRHGGDDRLFVAERNGRIRVINTDGTLRSVPFLDITSKISSASGEEGFLGFCFSPNYQTNGKFYVSYTANLSSQLTSVIEEYRVSSDPNVADPTSNLTILTVNQPANNHNGGNILFGPDGFLYIFFGDGGGGGDPFANGQDKTTLLGKILRLDVSNASISQPYVIPATNPFFNTTDGTKKEIWAYGLRNPWRNSFDRITNDLWVADVGQSAREEINFQPATSAGGENYGWVIMEGNICYPPPTPTCNTAGLKMPIYDYSHSVGSSITGGNVYRSVQSRDLWGFYLYSDFNFSPNKWLDGFKQSGGVVQGSVVRLINNVGSTPPIAFGEDRYGEIYMCLNGNGTLFKLEDANANRFPKAFFTNTLQAGGQLQLNALPGRNISYQWLFNDAPISGATGLTYLATDPGQYKLSVTNALSNTDISAPITLAALPVTLKDFIARRLNESAVELSWSTLSEQNNKGFEIERKEAWQPEFVSIQSITSKASGGNSDKELNYSFTDNIRSTEAILYRLKQLNTDGKTSYSPAVLVKGSINYPGLLISPNPASNFVNITTGANEYYQVQLLNINGQVMAKNNFTGSNYRMPVQAFPKGVYYIKLVAFKNGLTTVQKIVINH